MMKRLFAVFALLALFATACGSSSETQTSKPSVNPDVEYGSWGDDDAPGDVVVVSAVDAPAAPQHTAQVLAYAIEASDSLSYSFEQGVSMQMSMMGINMDISPEVGFISGQVSGADSYVLVDLGLFMGSMFESFGMNPNDPLFANMVGDLDNMTMEVWATESTLIMDLSSLAVSLGSLDPAAAGELALFADGPVSIDLNAMASLGGMDAADIVYQFGQGTQATDPALFIDSLRAVDAVTETGPGTVGDTRVTVYTATLTMADYYAALDMDITDQLGSLEGMGISPGSKEAEFAESMLPAIDDLTVDMTIMIDAAGLVRRIETDLDLGAMMDAMSSSGELEGADMLGDVSIQVNTWQNFDDYGNPVTIVVPESVDRTSELVGLLDA